MALENADMIAAVHRYVEAFDKADLEIIRDIYAEDAVLEDPVGTEPKHGMEAILGFYGPSLSAARLELTGAPRCAGNCVAWKARCDFGCCVRFWTNVDGGRTAQSVNALMSWLLAQPFRIT